MKLNHFFLNSAISLAVLLGLFTLYIWILVLNDFNFYTLVNYSWILIPIAIITLFFLLKDLNFESDKSPQISIPFSISNSISKALIYIALTLLAIAIILTTLGIDETFLLPWSFLFTGIFVLFIAVELKPVDYRSEDNIPEVTGNTVKEFISLSITGLLLVTAYVFSNKIDADDTHFVSYIVGLLQFPGSPLFSQDVIFQNGSENFIFYLNFGQSWEALTALITQLTGINHLSVYYLYLPVIFLFFSPVPVYYFTKLYFPKFLWVSVLFTFIIIFSWSTDNYLHGHFFIPRFYQGKAILLSFLLPLLFFVTRQLVKTPNFKLAIITILILIASGGSSSTGLYISVLTAGITFLAFTPLKPSLFFKRAIIIFILSSPNLYMALEVKKRMGGSPRQQTEQINLESIPLINQQLYKKSDNYIKDQRPITSMYWLFGNERYLAMFLIMFIGAYLLFTFKPSGQQHELRRFYLIIALIAFNHPLSSFLAETIGPGNLVWRFHWIIPLSLIASLFCASLLNSGTHLTRPYLLPVFGIKLPSRTFQYLAFCLVILVSGIFVFKRYISLNQPFTDHPKILKVHSIALSVAEYLVRQQKPNEVILADDRVSGILPMLIRQSELISSRHLYWRSHYFVGDDRRKRKLLQFLINNIRSWTEEEFNFLLTEIKQREITTLAFEKPKFDPEQKSVYLYERLYSTFNCSELNKRWVVCQKTEK